MNIMSKFAFVLCLLTISMAANTYIVPFGGNAWTRTGTGTIDFNGFSFNAGTSNTSTAVVFAYVSAADSATLSLNLTSSSSGVIIQVQVGPTTFDNTAPTTSTSTYIAIGVFPFTVGYNRIVVMITGATGDVTGVCADLKIIGQTNAFEISNFVSDPAEFAAGRAGFGVGVTFNTAPFYKANLIYAEIMIPTGSDVPGTNFYGLRYDNGFLRFNITEDGRKFISFSLISADTFTTNVNDLAPIYQIVSNAMGFDVGVSSMGGQNFYDLEYNWEAGVTYKLVIKDSTSSGTLKETFSAWFYDPSLKDWIFLATSTASQFTNHFTNLNAAIEPTSSKYGDQPRSFILGRLLVGQFQRQIDFLAGSAVITNSTPTLTARRDTFAGVDSTGQNFLLKTGGFFDETTTAGTQITRDFSASILDVSFLQPFLYSPITVPLGGCAYAQDSNGSIGADGFHFTALSASFNAYVYAEKAGSAALSLSVAPHDGEMTTTVKIGKQSQNATCAPVLHHTHNRHIKFGIFNFEAGYNKIEVTITSVVNSLDPPVTAGSITSIGLVPQDGNLSVKYTVANPALFYYWRIPASPTIQYLRPTSELQGIQYIEWMYVEISIPTQPIFPTCNFVPNGDKVGITRLSVTSEGTKTIEFIITRASAVLEQYVLLEYASNGIVNLLDNVQDVGYSIRVTLPYDWSMEATYKFITHASPNIATMQTVYTSYFYDPLISKWVLLGKVLIKDKYSYIEHPFSNVWNQNADQGEIKSRAFFGNIWFIDDQGGQSQISAVKYHQEDGTLPPEVADLRRDQWLGLNKAQHKFYLATGGFSNHHTEQNTILTKKPSSYTSLPVDINSLPVGTVYVPPAP